MKSKTRTEFWQAKLAANKMRDARQQQQLQDLGWTVEVVWECQCRDQSWLEQLAKRILRRHPS